MKRIACILLCIIICAAFFGCSGSDSAGTVRIVMNDCPDNIDPQLAEDSETLAIVRNCFEGLFRIDNGQTVKAVCSDYKVSDDGLKWEFTLQDAKWSDGKKVTAADFVFGIQRAITPDTMAPDAQLLSCIKGADKVLAGDAAPDTAGVTASGDKKLIITLQKAENDLPEILTRTMCMPCREDIFTDAGGRYGMSADLIVCNGPFYLVDLGTSVQIEKNEHYSGKFTARCAKAVFTFGSTDSERIDSLNSDIATVAVISSSSLDEADSADLDITKFNDTAWAVMINPSADVAGDDAVAAALKSAVSADSYADALPGGYAEFGGIIADSLLVDGKYYSEAANARNALSGNKQARQNLVNALKKHDGKLPTLTLIYPQSTELKSTAARLAQYWQQQLGAVINIKAVSSDKLTEKTQSGDYQLALCPITADDGTGVTAVRAFISNQGNAVYGFSVNGVEKLVGVSGSVSADTLKKAEKLLLDEPHIIPIAISGHCYAHSGELTNVRLDMVQGNIALY